jgi:hypothetical protein
MDGWHHSQHSPKEQRLRMGYLYRHHPHVLEMSHPLLLYIPPICEGECHNRQYETDDIHLTGVS